jgi:hypothetical protein
MKFSDMLQQYRLKAVEKFEYRRGCKVSTRAPCRAGVAKLTLRGVLDLRR